MFASPSRFPASWLGLARRHELLDVALVEAPEGPARELLEPEVPDPDPLEADQLVAEAGEEALDLVVPALEEGDLELAHLAADLVRSDVRGRGLALGHPDALTDRLHGLALDSAADLHDVGLGDLVARMGHALGEVAVVRDQDQALAVLLEPPGRVETEGHVAEVIDDLGASHVGRRRADHAGGLVEGEGHLGLELEPAVLEAHVVALGVHEVPHLPHHLAADGHVAVGDQALALEPPADARLGEELVKPHPLRHVLFLPNTRAERASVGKE